MLLPTIVSCCPPTTTHTHADTLTNQDITKVQKFQEAADTLLTDLVSNEFKVPGVFCATCR
jgi:hypothetical protein